MKNFLFTIFLALLIAGCGNNGNGTGQSAATDTTRFFNLADYIEQQKEEVHRTPFFIYKITQTGGTRDSVAIDNSGFDQLAQGFIQADINEPKTKKYYTESIFYDQTTKSYTLSYTTGNKSLEVQHIDVLLAEDAETVKRLFVRKFKTYNGDSSAIEQLSWKPGEQFQIVRMTQMPDNSEINRQTVVVWNAKP